MVCYRGSMFNGGGLVMLERWPDHRYGGGQIIVTEVARSSLRRWPV